MMKNMGFREGDVEVVKTKGMILGEGTYMKLWPRTIKFTSLSKPRDVFEAALKGYSYVANGDMIRITHNYHHYYIDIDIVETKPGNATCLVDIYCEVEFAPSLDSKKPEKSELRQ
ncbi:hypothetical protein RJ640_029366 [Escallonia rubra]|uniref:Ubiquitin fusion degradation protein UFD1 N-terminal subdomain 2 domain-containing protein n=1 Tax=Escallonia rubra TaxID=112253 RepID=A0AA88UL48_9ASTE|nr:hypothetical protein RJ640_029366 [Escallonia rubra]